MSKLFKSAGKSTGLIFDENKAKPHLKMAIQQIQIQSNKKMNSVKSKRSRIAGLLRDDKEESARVMVEQVIRDCDTLRAYEVLEPQCALLVERMRHIVGQKECPRDIQQAVCTVIWVADKGEISQLSDVKKQFKIKYGKEFIRIAEENEGGCVNQTVVEMLRVAVPSPYSIQDYLVDIATQYEVNWAPSEFQVPQEHTENKPSGGGGETHETYPSQGETYPPSGIGGTLEGRGVPVSPVGPAPEVPLPVTAWPVAAPGHPQVPGHGMPGWNGGNYGGMGTAGPAASGQQGGYRGPEHGVRPDTPPPEYSVHDPKYDIPSPPRTQPSFRMTDVGNIPAAPGHEDTPPRSGGGMGYRPPGRFNGAIGGVGGVGDGGHGGGGEQAEDLAARLERLRNG